MGAVVELTDEEWALVEHLFDPPPRSTVFGQDLATNLGLPDHEIDLIEPAFTP